MRLWHHEFGMLAFANLLLTMSVYMQIPFLSEWLSARFDPLHTGLVMGSCGVGLFLFGPYCSYWVQRYRRNRVYMFSVVLLTAAILCMFACMEKIVYWHINAWMLTGLRIFSGAAFGLTQMVLCSTLIVDACESELRTQANCTVAWFGRFALPLGMISALFCRRFFGDEVLLVAAACAFFSLILIALVKFPFRAPEETVHIASIDRFYLKEGTPLFVNLALLTTVVGMILTLNLQPLFFGLMALGFVLVVLAEKFILPGMTLSTETVAGMVLTVSSLILALCGLGTTPAFYVAPVMLGMGVGLVGSSFLLLFIRLSHHCQRGTSQSSFILSWELGVSVGLFAGFALFSGKTQEPPMLWTALVLTVASLLLFLFFTLPWYGRHKKR